MAKPFCEKTRKLLIRACKEIGLTVHESGTAVTIEGPRFSSKAESNMFRMWGGDVVNMTTVPEVCLAMEAGLCYASIALPTDYDCWKDTGEPVSVQMVLTTLKANAEKAKSLLLKVVPLIAQEEWSDTFKENKELLKISVMLP
jgi:5'-methylthioadenosine phosphorylase